MHDRRHSGSIKPDKVGASAPEPKSIRGCKALECKSQDAAGLGTRPSLPAREDAQEAVADLVPERPRLFNFDAQGVRVVGASDQPWFVAKDVCAALEVTNHRDALASLEDDEKGVAITDTLGGAQEMLTVNESGLYALIFRSRKPSARLFRRWVTSEVLPALRRTGQFGAPLPDPRIAAEAPAPLTVVGRFSLPVHSGPELTSMHVAVLLDRTCGDQAQWSGKITELAVVAVEHNLLWWLVRDPLDIQHRAMLGIVLHRRLGVEFSGQRDTVLRLSIEGRGRARVYLIERGMKGVVGS